MIWSLAWNIFSGHSVQILGHEHTSDEGTVSQVATRSTYLVSRTVEDNSWSYLALMIPILGFFFAKKYEEDQKKWSQTNTLNELGYLPSSNCTNEICWKAATALTSPKRLGILGGCGLLLPIFLLTLALIIIRQIFHLITLPFRLCCSR